MATQGTFHRFLAVSVAVAALLPAAPNASAADAEDAPFAKSYKVADATLDTMRGGFEVEQKGIFHSHDVGVPPPKVNFGLDVTYKSTANGHTVAQFVITNGGNKNNPVTFTETGLGKPDTIAPGQVVTTSLTNQGVLTVIQNVRSNTTLQTVQSLNATVTGMSDFVRATAHNSFHNSRVLFH
jgi:hypothetical protein